MNTVNAGARRKQGHERGWASPARGAWDTGLCRGEVPELPAARCRGFAGRWEGARHTRHGAGSCSEVWVRPGWSQGYVGRRAGSGPGEQCVGCDRAL